MPLESLTQDTAFDAESGVEYLVIEPTSEAPTERTWTRPVVRSAMVIDDQGNRAGVSPNGSLQVVQHGGRMPVCGSDAAGADAYAAVMVIPEGCHYLAAACTAGLAGGVLLSLDGGVTDALALAPGTTAVFPGVLLVGGNTIYAKNLAAGTNYANLVVSLW